MGGFGPLRWEGAGVLGSAWESEPRLLCGSLAPWLLGVGLGAVGSGCLLSVVPEPRSGQRAGLSWLRGRSEPQDLSFLGLLGTPKSVGAPSRAGPWGGTGGRGTGALRASRRGGRTGAGAGRCTSPRLPGLQPLGALHLHHLRCSLPPGNSALPPAPPISGAAPTRVQSWASGHCPWMKGNEGERVWGRWLR